MPPKNKYLHFTLLSNKTILIVQDMKGGMLMVPCTNNSGKRVCDISEDGKFIIIRNRKNLTRITANPDGTLKIENIDAKLIAS